MKVECVPATIVSAALAFPTLVGDAFIFEALPRRPNPYRLALLAIRVFVASFGIAVVEVIGGELALAPLAGSQRRSSLYCPRNGPASVGIKRIAREAILPTPVVSLVPVNENEGRNV